MYAIEHNGLAIGPSGPITDVDGVKLEASDVNAYNKALEAQELQRIKTGPERLMLYVKHPDPNKMVFDREGNWTVTTWLGTHVGIAWVTQRYRMGFGHRSYRRAITARIEVLMDGEAGESGLTKWVDYHGWYYESSGDYCRLKRAKVQGVRDEGARGEVFRVVGR